MLSVASGRRIWLCPQPTDIGLGADPTALGHLPESFVFTELEKPLPFLAKRWRLYHWRLDAREIDVVAEARGKRLALFELPQRGCGEF